MEPTAGLVEAALVCRHFTDGSVDPFDTVEWEVRDAWTPESLYYNPGLTVPTTWGQHAVDIASKLYLARGNYEERSIKKMIQRVASKYATEGSSHGYFGGVTSPSYDDKFGVEGRVEWITSLHEEDQARVFYDELCYMLLNQMAAFNSPVWFNVGRPDRKQQVSACFILGVEDTTDSIMDTSRREASIFRLGSGSGFDISRLRGSSEPLSTGGTSSGPVSFMRMWDAEAGTFKSGGQTRRAAKLVKCDADHPDIRDFITCKQRDEDRMRTLAGAGVDIGFSAEAECTLAEFTSFQNANNSVGVTDEFMRKGSGDDQDSSWPLVWRTARRYDGSETPTHVDDDAEDLLDLIADAAWDCADPGLMFMDKINSMHTTPSLNGVSSPIRSANPCVEYMSNDDTSCNLASINVIKFLQDHDMDTGFDTVGFCQVVDVMITAMDISISFGHLPDDRLKHNTRGLRQLGLGYSNMGATIMAQGYPYDSEEGRDFAASVSALLTGSAYYRSARLAEVLGTFDYFDENRDAMLDVIQRHVDALPDDYEDGLIWSRATISWNMANTTGVRSGFRNAQASVVAPAGTISYLMGCDTTGIEPAFQLVSHKQLAGGDSMLLINQSVARAAQALGGYSEENLKALAMGDTSCISEEDLPTFAGANEISADGHIKMLAAVQPFISGGISKTINMPESATPQDIKNAYITAWRTGVKALSIYRNNSKARQVLSSTPKKTKVERFAEVAQATEVARESALLPPARKRMPRTREARRHKIHVRSSMGDHEGYVSASFYADGRIGEIFLEGFGRMGGFTQNVLSAWATDFSIALQYGVPFDVLVRKHIGHSDETGGVVVPDGSGTPLVIRSCDSIVDYIAKWLVSECGDVDLCEQLGIMTPAVKERKMNPAIVVSFPPEASIEVLASTNGHAKSIISGPPCSSCGGIMYRAGACWQCRCGQSSGCS